MKIFDAHAHLGSDEVFDVKVDEQDLLNIYEQYQISGALIQPFICKPYLEDTKSIHDRIDAFTKKYPQQFYGMISINPHLREHEVEDECTRCIKKLGFKGIKIATTAHGVSPSSKNGMHIFEIANTLGIPVMVHTGGGNFGAPIHLNRPIEAFPHVPIIIAHGGGESGMEQCILLAKKYDQVYVEPSWVSILGIEKMLRVLGSEKIMYSSDMPQNTPIELATYRAACNGNDQDLDNIFNKTAKKVFSLDI